ncbi:MAG TPA: hypothetical protein PKW86_08195 [bacterium]|mgnify:FL=1|nr:hypothetical protein [bacterium]
MKLKIFSMLALIFLCGLLFGAVENTYFINPYDGITWEQVGQYKANLHIHTTASDGKLHPQNIVDIYASSGYKILSITDHSEMNKNPGNITYPWENFKSLITSNGKTGLYEDRNAKSIGMIAVPGREISQDHDVGSYFNLNIDIASAKTIEDVIESIEKNQGLAVLVHPGRYHFTDAWYVSLFKKYPVIVGMEVYNQGDRYPSCKTIWDNVLTKLMPDRPVWGFSNDDAHRVEHIGKNWNMFLLSNLTTEELRNAMEKGHFYFIYCPDGVNSTPAIIKKIEVDNKNMLIHIEAINCSKIEWISNGKIVGTGPEYQIKTSDGKVANYVRAKLYGSDNRSVTETQPFGIREQVSR